MARPAALCTCFHLPSFLPTGQYYLSCFHGEGELNVGKRPWCFCATILPLLFSEKGEMREAAVAELRLMEEWGE